MADHARARGPVEQARLESEMRVTRGISVALAIAVFGFGWYLTQVAESPPRWLLIAFTLSLIAASLWLKRRFKRMWEAL